jgi:hypothetical protein
VLDIHFVKYLVRTYTSTRHPVRGEVLPYGEAMMLMPSTCMVKHRPTRFLLPHQPKAQTPHFRHLTDFALTCLTFFDRGNFAGAGVWRSRPEGSTRCSSDDPLKRLLSSCRPFLGHVVSSSISSSPQSVLHSGNSALSISVLSPIICYMGCYVFRHEG